MGLRQQNVGEIKNYFGLLTKDFQKVDGVNYRKFLNGHFTSEEAAKKINKKSRASIYHEEISIPKDFIEKYLVPIVIAADYAYLLFDKDAERAKNWILLPNSYFFGRSPFNICIEGNGQEVILFLKDRLGESENGNGNQ